ncbi:MAG: DUF2156 domain-containing protein [Microbacteriaceae bacterium]|nr:DUF2156 domain-containing protein [Microbacteriaceae bacterium]
MKFIRGIPLTLSLAGLVVLVAILSNTVVGPLRVQVRERFGTGIDTIPNGNFFSPITSVFLVSGLAQLIIVVIAIVLLVGTAERLMGSWRTLVAFVVTSTLGNIAGMVLQAAGVLTRELWSLDERALVTADPFTPIAGTMMAASAFAGALWRRRIRLLGFSVLLMFALYSGQPGDMFRLLAALIGLGLGAVFSKGRLELSWRRSSHSETRGLLAAILAITALGPVITIFSRVRAGPLHSLGLLFRDVLPYYNSVAHHCRLDLRTQTCLRDFALARLNGPGPVLLTLLPLLVLLVSALGVLRGKRFAAYLAIAVNLLLAALAAFYYGFLRFSAGTRSISTTNRPLESTITLLISVLVPLIVAIVLAFGLRHLIVHSARIRIVRFLLAIVGALVVLSTAYLFFGWLDRQRFQPPVSFWDLITDLPERYIPVGFLGLERLQFVPTGFFTKLLYGWIGPVFWLVILIGALAVLGSIFHKDEDSSSARGKALLTSSGGGTLSFMTTWSGNHWWFAENGGCAVAYRVIGGVAITVSDPIGPESQHELAVRGFATFCDDHAWIPVFYSVHESLRGIFASMGWSTLDVAEEMVIRPQGWQMIGPKWQDVRTAINRAERSGIKALWTTYSLLPLHLSSQIEEISELWVAEHNLPELGFTLGGFEEIKDDAVSLMLAIGPDDRVEAVTSWMPIYRGHENIGWTLDFMRRRPDSMPGVMEFLISSVVLHAQASGIEVLSLSAAPLARVANDNSIGMEKLLDFIATSLEPLYGFRSLQKFKSKFQPESQNLIMAFPDPAVLPKIGSALAKAYLPIMSIRQRLALLRELI